MAILDAKRSRPYEGGTNFTLKHRLFRAIWAVTWTLFASWTPSPMHGWRRFLLRLFGAKIASGAHVYSSARIWFPPNLEMESRSCLGPRANCYAMDRIVIGPDAIVSQDAELCAGSHDIGDPEFRLIANPIFIGERAWIAAGAFIGPGVTIGAGAVLGARAVTFKDIPPWEVHVGNPARFLKKRSQREN